MKNGWQIKKLDDVCDFASGLWTGKKPPFVNVGVIRNTNFTKNHELDDSDIVCLNVEEKQFTRRKLQYGDLILEKSGGGPKQPVGRVIIFDKKSGDYSFSNFTSMIRVKNKTVLNFSYLHKFLMFLYISGFTETIQSNSTGIRNLKFDDYKSIGVPIPPLPEQQLIVALLDEAFAGIAKATENAQKNLVNARELFESHLQSIFTTKGDGWVEKKLGDVCAITSMLVDPRKEEFVDLTHIGAGNIESQTGVFVELKTAREEGLISGKFIFDESMVLYSKIRPYLMKVARPNFSGLCSADMYPLAPLKNQITRDYLYYLLLSKNFTEYAIQGSARAGMPKVNREHLFDFRLWLPTIEQQKGFAAQLDVLTTETKRLEVIYQQKLKHLTALKQSLLQKAFAGELHTDRLAA